MGRNLDPKCKQCRRLGEKLFLKGERCNTAKCGIVKRNFPPGVHGAKGKTRQTEYGLQLQEKQRAMKEYRLMEKQFRLNFEKAKNQTGNVNENFLRLLETRLDNTIYRLGFAESRDKARQLITHGHIRINNKKVTIPSYTVKTGDIITIKESSKQSKVFSSLTDKLKKFDTPSWLNLEANILTGKVLHSPTIADLNVNFNPQMIVEYYSR
ncbi:MAG: SSU ribosomal protein S4p (S9e) [Parcubacteria group bacterium GW2011_GWE2_39_37]|uniref:Small ribosomal subunit protein uS4 n=1 Tax=Candidatus Falkowbacteria bacterium GW2011_GWF2_39_8 TaxID=1618642 RepID=A0A0G0T3I8_9BACT|nr:MAG: SSU ribosomal protein S4p (S9e) [Parcubacteria group bacterium GW2011_GWE2_39_37]KKR32402.1 MAG: SSU ribosomal protein S4p (S9e) [Candidatus Falkowbacteria bacterium GW2011_GWF2_39_8]